MHFFLHNWAWYLDKNGERKPGRLHDEDPDYDLALEKLKLFDFIGFTDDLDGFVRKIEKYMGWSRVELEKVNATPKSKRYQWDEAQEATLREILKPELSWYAKVKRLYGNL